MTATLTDQIKEALEGVTHGPWRLRNEVQEH